VSILPENYDYTDKDFDAMRSRLIDLAKSVFPEWTDFEIANFGNVILEMFAFVLDVLIYYQDNQAPEGRWGFVQLRRNAIALAKLIGYELSGASAATADCTITLANGPLAGDVPVPLGSVIQTLEVTDPIKGEIIGWDGSGDPVIPAGSLTVDVQWEHSLTKQTVFTSDGLADQEKFLPFSPYLDGSIEISTTSYPTGWTEVDNFLESGPNDLHFTVSVDQNDHATIGFGDGTNGKIPPDGDTITADYKTGGGLEGNVDAASLVKLVGTFSDSLGNPAYLRSTNAAAAAGGAERETVEAARSLAPQSLRVLNRTVAREDYEINALRVPGVGRALMLSSNEDTGISENHGRLYVIPSSGSTPSAALKASVLAMVTETYPNTITFQVEVLDPAYLDVDVRATIWLREGYSATAVKAAIQAALVDWFEPLEDDGTANANVDFGYNYKDADGNPAGEISWSDIFNVVRDVPGVRKIGAGPDDFLLNGVSDDVPISNHQFPRLGTVVLINGATSTQI